MRGASQPPSTCAPATMAAARPATEYAPRIAKELKQVRLKGVEDIDPDAGAERRGQHHVTHRRVLQSVLDRGGKYGTGRTEADAPSARG